MKTGRDERIWTADPTHPKRVRYQAAPRPDCVRMVIIAEKLNITKEKSFIALVFQLCDDAFEFIFDLEEGFL